MESLNSQNTSYYGHVSFSDPLKNIFSFFDGSSLVQAQAVCKVWRQILKNDPSLWKNAAHTLNVSLTQNTQPLNEAVIEKIKLLLDFYRGQIVCLKEIKIEDECQWLLYTDGSSVFLGDAKNHIKVIEKKNGEWEETQTLETTDEEKILNFEDGKLYNFKPDGQVDKVWAKIKDNWEEIYFDPSIEKEIDLERVSTLKTDPLVSQYIDHKGSVSSIVIINNYIFSLHTNGALSIWGPATEVGN